MHWNWKIGGVALGLTFFAAVLLVKPIGVSTQYVIVDGIIADAVRPDLVVEDSAADDGWTSTNPYLAKSGGKYARAVARPLGYGLVFVLSMALGGFLGRRKPADGAIRTSGASGGPPGGTPLRRALLAFTGGVLVLWGARLAGGCTSGHMMSGTMQGALSGWIFAAAVFAAAVPAALLIGQPRRGAL